MTPTGRSLVGGPQSTLSLRWRGPRGWRSRMPTHTIQLEPRTPDPAAGGAESA